jgi:multimeric flavodoxin WrbA
VVVNEMLAADGLIFGSPVYVNHISALMKSFFDRIGYESHRPRFFGKQALRISKKRSTGTRSSRF